MLFALLWPFILAAPYFALTIAGLLLWKHSHSVPTALVALGFAAALLSHGVSIVEGFELSSIVRVRSEASFIVTHHNSVALPIYYGGIVGLWAASVGLIWHAVQRR